jgi:putative PIN family toxin of toxin-antitoxin system
MERIVIDTNVFISALRSTRGASYKLLFETNRSMFAQNISTPLILEYESVAKRELPSLTVTAQEVDAILDMICKNSEACTVSFRWRPYLKDPGDDFILELAVQSQSKYIVTYNKADFAGVEDFGIALVTPREFLQILGEIES